MADEFEKFYNTIISSNLEAEHLSKKTDEAKSLIDSLIQRKVEVRQEGERLHEQLIVKRKELCKGETELLCVENYLEAVKTTLQACEEKREQLQLQLEEREKERSQLQETLCRDLREFNATFSPFQQPSYWQQQQAQLQSQLSQLKQEEEALQKDVTALKECWSSVCRLKEERSQLNCRLEELQQQISDLELLKAEDKNGDLESDEKLLLALRQLDERVVSGNQRILMMRGQVERLEVERAQKMATSGPGWDVRHLSRTTRRVQPASATAAGAATASAGGRASCSSACGIVDAVAARTAVVGGNSGGGVSSSATAVSSSCATTAGGVKGGGGTCTSTRDTGAGTAGADAGDSDLGLKCAASANQVQVKTEPLTEVTNRLTVSNFPKRRRVVDDLSDADLAEVAEPAEADWGQGLQGEDPAQSATLPDLKPRTRALFRKSRAFHYSQ